MRTFLGIPATEEIRKRAESPIEKIKIDGVNIVRPENLHFTVRFFGETDNSQLKEIEKKIDDLEIKSFKIRVGGVGVFPNESYMKVLWLGVTQGNKKFTETLEKINNLFGGSKRKPVPHMTLARVKFVKDRKELLEKINEIKKIDLGMMKMDQ